MSMLRAQSRRVAALRRIAVSGALSGVLAMLVGGCLLEETGGEYIDDVEQDLAVSPGEPTEVGTPQALGLDRMEPDPEPWCPPTGEDEKDHDGDEVIRVVPKAPPGTPGHDSGDGEGSGSKD